MAAATPYRDEAGVVRPTFPNARYVVQRGELEYASHTNERTAASYLPHNFAPVAEAGLFDLVEGERQIVPGIQVVPTPGHVPFHQGILLESKGERAFFLGDLVPTARASAAAVDHGLRRRAAGDARDEAAHAGAGAEGGVAASSSSTMRRTRGGDWSTTGRRTRWRP